MTSSQRLSLIRAGVVAGAAGGLAEIAWIALYATVTGADPADLARGVTTAAGAQRLLPTVSPEALGVTIHMALAVALGITLLVIWRSLHANCPILSNPYPFMLAALAGVWALNFFVVLPMLSPSFVHLAPYAVSLTSKLLFGAAAAVVVSAAPTFGTLEAAKATKTARP